METKTKKIFMTISLFFIAGLFEIGGAYLIWLWLREGFIWILGILGLVILFSYGVIQTFQPSHFHRIYAAYGGVFIVMALFWGWIFDNIAPDTFDLIGAFIALIGAGTIFYWPRRGEKIW